ncbi:MAG: hypothetical protein PHU59_02825 [Candidatus Omnitrophica bacterium]|jgi:Ca2+-dependent lipid-binding protein|nr:hypothetical protein [Candidatus Omnitrophota bacterium]
MPTSNFVFTGQSGCLLPILIIFNFFFGKLIFSSTRLWLGIEAILILLFIIKIHIFTRKITEQLRQAGAGPAASGPKRHGRGRVVDIQGEVVEEKQKLE